MGRTLLMAKLGYTGHTIQIVKAKGEDFVFYWSPSPVADKELDKFGETLDFLLETMEDDRYIFVDKWDFIKGIHGR